MFLSLSDSFIKQRIAQVICHSPSQGRTKCFLGDGAPTFFYFHLFTGPCLLFNLAGFVCTSWNLCCGVWAAGGGRGGAAEQQQQLAVARQQQRNRYSKRKQSCTRK